MPPSDFLNDPASESPPPATDASSANRVSLPSANGDEETALARLADDGGPSPPPAEIEASSEPITAPSLEQRVRRLEEMVARLQERRAVPTERPPEARPVLPSAVPAPPAATAVMLDLGKRLLGPTPPAAPAAPFAIPSLASAANRSGLLWLLWDTWAEARAIVRMFLDPRYQLPWAARVLSLVLLAAILTSYYWVPGTSIPVVGTFLDKAVDLLLAFLLFKWLGHEARRYRQTSPDLPANLRL